jgi:Na+/pantothenate symporter
VQIPVSGLKSYLWLWTRALTDLDPRSLACFRIGLGAVLLYDISLIWDVIDLWPGMQAYFAGLPLPDWAQPAGDVATLKWLFGVYVLFTLGLIFLVAYAVILLPINLYTGARGLNGMLDMTALTGIESELGIITFTVLLVGLIGTTYAIFGGLRTVAVSDTLNGIGLLIGGLLIVYFALQAVSGGEGVFAGLAKIGAEHPDRFNSIAGPTLFTGVLLLNLFYWCTNQQIIQRTFGAKNL